MSDAALGDVAHTPSDASFLSMPEGAGQPNYTMVPKTSATGEFEGELLEVAMGPQHPSTHGVFRMDVVLDGERVMKLKPVFGYLHRNHEKIAEQTSYLGSMPYTDRLDYFCSLTNNWAYALAVEQLAGLQAPDRAEYIRIITAELTGDSVTTSVADRGPGIDDLEQGMIFDKFYRGKDQRYLVRGTGMGLPIAKAIVAVHKGTIGVMSQLGHGSVFSFSLPVARGQERLI